MPHPCEQDFPLTSTRRRRSTGVFTDSNRREAATRATRAVSEHLTQQIDGITCTPPCFKEPPGAFTINVRQPVRCKRYWFTFFIVVRCWATADGSVTLRCRVPGG
ncbi:MAG: hypothetical protein ACE5G0_01495 [Rhodothermales bacterium]